MNALERCFCSNSVWRYITRAHLLPWILAGCDLGDFVLEIGAGAGAATAELRQRASRVVSLEYDRELAMRLARRSEQRWMTVQGDASVLPFADKTFSSVISILMLHHLTSKKLQDNTFVEIQRVLRPGGKFLAFDIQDGWWHRTMHWRSTFVPLEPALLPQRMETAGFHDVKLSFQGKNFRVRALR